jgi:N-succinyldiaminopimelate aminotransferase
MTASALGQLVAERAKRLLQTTPAPASAPLDLSAEFPSGSTADSVRSATAAALEKHLCDHYTRRPGIAPLCRVVAQSLSAAGVEVDPNDGVVVAGSVDEARYVAVRALAAGKSVYQPRPAPTCYAAAIDFAGATVQTFDLSQPFPVTEGGLLLLSNPNPLTGQVLGDDALARLAVWAEAADLAVVADETHAALLRPDATFQRFASLPGMLGRTLTIGSFADTPGLGAWQVSWFAGVKPLLTTVRDLKQAITICTAAPSQYAALAATAEADREGLVEEVERLEAVTALLDRHNIPYYPPHTATYVVADVGKLGGGDAVSAACAVAGVRVGNGAELGNPGALRIGVTGANFGHSLQALESAFAALEGQ